MNVELEPQLLLIYDVFVLSISFRPLETIQMDFKWRTLFRDPLHQERIDEFARKK